MCCAMPRRLPARLSSLWPKRQDICTCALRTTGTEFRLSFGPAWGSSPCENAPRSWEAAARYVRPLPAARWSPSSFPRPIPQVRSGPPQSVRRDEVEAIRILIADDHPLFRDGMRGLLESVSMTEFVGEATTGDEAIAQAEALLPDVVLMDIKMPGANGIDATREIIRTSPNIGVLMVTMYEDDDFVFAAMRAGARGYVLKGANQDEVLRAIRAVANGEVIFSAPIAQRVIRFLTTPPPAPPTRVFPELT